MRIFDQDNFGRSDNAVDSKVVNIPLKKKPEYKMVSGSGASGSGYAMPPIIIIREN